MSETYSAVDASDDVAGAIAWQERVDRWPAIARYKAAMDRLIGDARPVLDIGAGPGTDSARTGSLAIDLSTAMARRARSFDVPVMVGDAHHLPVGDRTMGAVRSDRVLQHLAVPSTALQEMVRVLRPGGRLVVADPDQQTLSITVPGVPDRITSTVRRLRRDVGYRNGRLAGRVASWLTADGMMDVRVEGSALVLTDPDLAFGLPGWVRHWRAEGGFTEADDELWRRCLADSKDRGFVYTVSYLVTSGVKPQ